MAAKLCFDSSRAEQRRTGKRASCRVASGVEWFCILAADASLEDAVSINDRVHM